MSQAQPSSPPNAAEAYEQLLVPHVFQPLAEELIRLAPPSRGDRVLDVACGTAIVLRRAAPLAGDTGRLAGIDMNPGMLKLARTICDANGISADFHQCTVDELPFPAGSFDRVYCQQAFQFFPDKLAALSEMRRVLTPDGRLVIAVWQSIDRHPLKHAIDIAAIQHSGRPFFADAHSLGDPNTLHQLISDAGFRDVKIEHVSVTMRLEDPEGMVRTWLEGATAGIRSLHHLDVAQKANLIGGVMSLVKPAIHSHMSDGRLVVPWHANVALARR